MDKTIHNTKAISLSILNYADEKEGALDDKGKAELKSFAARLDVLLSDWQGTKEALSAAKDALALSVDSLRRAIVQSRKALEMVAVGERKLPCLPIGVKGKWFASRIHDFGVSHMQALENAGDDQVIAKTRATLKAAIDAFVEARSEHRSQQFAWKNLRAGIDDELSVISGKLGGFKAFASYNVPRTERKVLRNRIRAVVPVRSHHRKTAEASASTTAATAQPPALPTDNSVLRRDGVTSTVPAIPATAVPPSNEHPIVSAHA